MVQVRDLQKNEGEACAAVATVRLWAIAKSIILSHQRGIGISQRFEEEYLPLLYKFAA